MIYGLLNRLALACATAGLAIATVLTVAHASNMPLPCGGSNGCDRVAQDPSSFYMGIPVSAFGIVAYVILIIAGVLRIWGVGLRLASFAGFFVSLMGTVASVLLTYYSITKIHATCLWCLGSGAMMILSTICYLGTPKASKGIKDGAKPLSAIPWGLIPLLVVGAIGKYGGATKQEAPDLSYVKLDKANFTELEASSHPLGDANARVTIVEFADLMCPACQAMQQKLLLFLIHQKGKVRLMYHHFPLGKVEGHELSQYAAGLSEQLDKDDFWDFVGKVYASEEKPTRSGLDKLFASYHGKHAKTEQAAQAEVLRDIKIGESYGVRETPTYILFIDKKPVAVASSVDMQVVIKRPEFAKIFAPSAAKAK